MLMRIKLKLKDRFFIFLYKIRYWFILNFNKKKLKNSSELEKENYELTFHDDFSKVTWNRLDPDRHWNVGEDWGMYHPDKLNVYYGPPFIRNGNGVFSVDYKPKNWNVKGKSVEIPYEVSLLSSQCYFRQTYGRFECRCTLPKEKGAWPAFWMWGEPWPPEIDVFECYGRKDGKEIVKQCISLHTDDRKTTSAGKVRIGKYKDVGKEFYEFVCEWSPDKIEFYTNGILISRVTDKKAINHFKTEQWVVINNSIMAEIDGSDKNYYSEFEVDYIRVYKKI